MIRQMQMILSYMKLMKNLLLIKTKADEYCFTNRAIIHVDGESAMSKKRLLRRYDYSMYTVTEVFLETAGTIDLDVEIKFTIGNSPLSIDIHKRFIDDIKDLYKALHAISYEQKNNAYKLEVAEKFKHCFFITWTNWQ